MIVDDGVYWVAATTFENTHHSFAVLKTGESLVGYEDEHVGRLLEELEWIQNVIFIHRVMWLQ